MWQDSWLSHIDDQQPFADVYKVQGMRGIYIASQIISDDAAKMGQIQPNDLVSLITFNQGGEWSPINSPQTDDEGNPFPGCGKSKTCSLHLAQQLSKKLPSSRSIPIASSESAIGIVMGSGNVGDSLKRRSDVFLSADAGLSWREVI